MSTISGIVYRPDGVTPVAGATITAELTVAVTSVSPGFLDPGPGELVTTASTPKTGPDGVWSLELTPNDAITPAGSVYRFTYRIPGAKPHAVYKRVGTSNASIGDLDVLGPQETPPFTQTTGGGSVPDGGSTGDILTKLSGTDGDADWEVNAAFADIANEASTRASADSSEATARAAGDSANATAITSEAATRATADTAEAAARATADTTEAAARVAGDALAIPLTQKAAASGVATLDAGGHIPSTQLPALVLSHTFVVASQAAMLALSTANTGDLAVRTDTSTTFILSGADPSILGNWTQLLFPGGGGVSSVNTRTGAVTGLAEQSDLDAEATARAAADSTEATARATADALLAPKASPTFSGVVTAPEYSASGLTGATAASRYVGATSSGAPVSGTFAKGDFVVDQTAVLWICTVSGTPGTWAAAGAAYTDAAIVGVVAAEFIRDTIGVALTAGARISVVVNDPGDTITIAVSGLTSSDLSDFATAVDERARDAVGAALVAGTGIVITPNDGADTITIAVSGLTSIALSDFTEAVQDVVGAFVAVGSGLTATYNDAGNVITIGVDDAQLAVDLGIPASLKVLLSSIDIPRRSLDRVRGAPNDIDCKLAADITSTATTVTVDNVNAAQAGTNPVKQIGSEQMLVIRGQGTTSWTVIRHVNGTTAAAHTTGDPIIGDKVRNFIGFGDSTAQGSATSVTGEWDAWVERFRRIANERFGGSLGHGFHGLWRSAHASIPQVEYDFSGTWFVAATSAAYFCGPWVNEYGTAATAILKWTRPAKVQVGQIDVWYIVWSSGTAGTGGDWSYSTDGGATWVNNPQAGVDNHPTSTTTLGSADNARRCDYWDGTKTMTLASVTGIENNGGFLYVDVGSGATFKCRALFTYDGVSGSTLTNVKYVGPSHYNALTTVTGDTVQKRPEIRKASIACTNPTDFRVRCGNAAGTDKLCMFAGLDIWNSVPTFGVTKGLKVHNLGYSGNTLGTFLGSRMVNDIGTTNGSPTMTSAGRGAFASTDVGSQVINANVPAGTVITAVASATSCTLSANATGTVTAGAVSNPTTIQGIRGAWDMAFNGCAVSLLPSLMVESCWTNDMSATVSGQGGDSSMTATFVSGSGSVTITGGNGTETLDVNSLLMNASFADLATAAGTIVSARADATHVTISPVATANKTAIAIVVGAPSATVVQAIKNRLTILHAGGIGGSGVSAYCDRLLVVPFEQGFTRLNGISSTAAYQADYRQAMHDWATANKVATLDIYKAWSAEGNVGYAAANADGLMDTGDTSAFHEGPVGYRDMASRITRLLEFA